MYMSIYTACIFINKMCLYICIHCSMFTIDLPYRYYTVHGIYIPVDLLTMDVPIVPISSDNFVCKRICDVGGGGVG